MTIRALALPWGPTRFVLRVEPVSVSTWGLVVAVAAVVVVASELHKALRRARHGGEEAVPAG